MAAYGGADGWLHPVEGEILFTLTTDYCALASLFATNAHRLLPYHSVGVDLEHVEQVTGCVLSLSLQRALLRVTCPHLLGPIMEGQVLVSFACAWVKKRC